MDTLRKLLCSLIILIVFNVTVDAQFKTWIGTTFEEEATDAHSIYRQALKAKDWDVAFENWQKAYDMAPAADGKRDYHFIDGVKLYVHKFQNETDEAKKTEYKENINRLYDEAVQAYTNRDIKPSSCGDDAGCYDKKIGYVYGRKGYDMFYSLNASYSKNLSVYDMALEKGGNDVEYTVFDPIAAMVVYQYQKGKLEKEKTLAYFFKMEEIAEYNAANNQKLGTYYDQAWKAAKAKFAPIETEIFDCDYFKPIYQKMYDENPDDMDQLKNLVGLLKKRGCDENDPMLVDLEGKWKVYAAKTNAARQAEFEANNPSVMAKKMYDSGDFEGAIRKYDEAINSEADPVKKGSYLFSKASIQFRKLKQYSKARATAREASKLRPNWGRPIVLIGDMYGSSARKCGDDWNQRLAIIAAIDKYNYAKSVDPEIAEEATERANKYYASLPDKTEGHMRGVKKGERVTVGCWIGESVSVRFKK